MAESEENMKASELLIEHYSELTEQAREVIETSDQFFDENVGEFDTAADFNKFYYTFLFFSFIT